MVQNTQRQIVQYSCLPTSILLEEQIIIGLVKIVKRTRSTIYLSSHLSLPTGYVRNTLKILINSCPLQQWCTSDTDFPNHSSSVHRILSMPPLLFCSQAPSPRCCTHRLYFTFSSLSLTLVSSDKRKVRYKQIHSIVRKFGNTDTFCICVFESKLTCLAPLSFSFFTCNIIPRTGILLSNSR